MLQMTKEERDKFYDKLFQTRKKMITVEKEIYKCERTIEGYKYYLEFEREICVGALFILPPEITKEYHEANIKLPKLQKEYDELAQELKYVSTWLEENAPKKAVCDHIGKCDLCVLWSKNGCKLVS